MNVNPNDRNDPSVVAALTHKCDACKAKPGEDCHSTIDGGPIPGRIVHYYRILGE
jgi:hypothetical protein